MPFHSAAFALLLLATLAFYWGLPGRYQHLALLLSSLAFYYYAGIADTVLLLTCVGANHLFSLGVKRKGWLAAAVIFNLVVLSAFKYRAFIAENLNAILGTNLPILQTAIPLGISFYLFQLIAYQVDLHRGEVTREPRAWRMLLYVLFFPHHQAGPIMRPGKFLPQFYGEKRWSPQMMRAGGWWILSGLAKKVAADRAALSVDVHFGAALQGPVSTAEAWFAALMFGFQIYGDFSGYSDIAVGLGKLFGYDLDHNFRQPYLARDPSDFWRRWHITLSQWLRDYLYVPLGGNRSGTARTHLNLFVTMLLGGLWHGASWLFVLWGALHGALLVAHKLLPRLFRQALPSVLLTFVAVHLAWVPFRASHWSQATRILRAMVVPTQAPGGVSVAQVAALAAMLACVYGAEALHRRWAQTIDRLWLGRSPAVRGMVVASAICIILLSISNKTTYIYFRF